MDQSIIVVGAGVSGILLRQGFQKAGIRFRVFERDASLGARVQGYRVRISDDGIEALRQSLSSERLDELKRYCSTLPIKNNIPTHVLSAIDGILKKPPVATKGPPLLVDRQVLRTALVKGIEAHIEFGKAFVQYNRTNTGIAVELSDGSMTEGPTLVGPDGAWSKVRLQLLPSYKLCDTGARPIFGKTPITKDFLSKFTSPQAMLGVTLLRSATADCLLKPMIFDPAEPITPANYVYWVLFSREDVYTDESRPDDQHSMLEIVQSAQQKMNNWIETFWCLSTQPNSSAGIIKIVISNPTKTPVSNAMDLKVVFVDAAAHVMAPTAALGATTALQDTAVLGPVEVALRGYKQEIPAYAQSALHKSMVSGKVMFGMAPFNELPLIGFRSTE
ncbi:FAD/NAD(P)-binding domain-containing protein [Polychaeton citri CBS 116435]|uniref:FAD/NAD(P)-binding domain-containing protein n=1 Tax=Polychaeton citri CBS 116435 TaxID=1314669 RepID=A0A9P4Q8M1_9PEZI|nr:FAD/NAD(P)-binding domain-containing protein [Polychaeton citri CBS 116435]